MKNFEETIADFDIHSPFRVFFEHGYTPEGIKREIVSAFDIYFKNKTNLNRYAIDGLSATWVAYLTISSQMPLLKKLKQVSSLVQNALKQDETLTLKTYWEWSENLNEATNKYWSIKNLEKNTKSLCLEDMAEASFQMLGQLIEGLMKPYIKFFYQLDLISNKKPTCKSDVESFDLGRVVQDLSNSSNKILIQPLNISLSQWRNIAYHHNYTVVDNTIVCTYGNLKNLKQFNLTRNKLSGVIKLIYSFFKVLKISESILLFDKLELLEPYFSANNKDEFKLRDESHLISFYSALSTQGFSVQELIVTKEKTSLTLQDLLTEEPIKRGIHSSQFLQNLWHFSKSKLLEIQYKKTDGSIYLISKIKSKYIDLYEKGNIDIEDLIKHTELDFVGDESIRQNLSTLTKVKNDLNKKDPFKMHLISAIPTKEKYFSQLGIEINAKEFIRDFTLAVFANYLVFRELGFKTDSLKINVGSDGAMVRLEDEKNILLTVPASIKEKFIQQILLMCIGHTITLFEKNQLVDQLILESKARHNFEANLTVVKGYLNDIAMQ